MRNNHVQELKELLKGLLMQIGACQIRITQLNNSNRKEAVKMRRRMKELIARYFEVQSMLNTSRMHSYELEQELKGHSA